MATTLDKTQNQRLAQQQQTSVTAAKVFRPRSPTQVGKSDSLMSDLLSIEKTVGTVAKDTYQLNEGIAQRVGQDHYARTVEEVNAIEQNLKPGESRLDAINGMSVLIAGKVASTNDFDGNVDMQEAYTKIYYEPARKYAAQKMTKWQGEQNAIDYEKYKVERNKWLLEDMPTIEDPASLDAHIDLLMEQGSAYEPQDKAKYQVLVAQTMSANFAAKVDANPDIYLFRGFTKEGSSKALAAVWNDAFGAYGSMDSRGAITYHTDNVEVNAEISKAWSAFNTKLNGWKNKASESRVTEIKALAKMYTSVKPSSPTGVTYDENGNQMSVNYQYTDNSDDVLAKINRVLIGKGQKPLSSKETILAADTYGPRITQGRKNDAAFANRAYGEKINVDVENMPAENQKNINASTAQKFSTNFDNNIATMNDQNALPEGREQAAINIGVMVKDYNDPQTAPIYRETTRNMVGGIANNYNSPEGFNQYRKYRHFIGTTEGRARISTELSSEKKIMRYQAYVAAYNKHYLDSPLGPDGQPMVKPFRLNPEQQSDIDNYVNGHTTVEMADALKHENVKEAITKYDGYKDLTPNERRREENYMKFKVLTGQPDESNQMFDGTSIELKNPDSVIKKNTSYGGDSKWVRDHISGDPDKEHKYLNNIEEQVFIELHKQQATDIQTTSNLRDNGMVLQERDKYDIGGSGIFDVYYRNNQGSLTSTGYAVNLSDWKGDLDYGNAEVSMIEAQIAEVETKMDSAYGISGIGTGMLIAEKARLEKKLEKTRMNQPLTQTTPLVAQPEATPETVYSKPGDTVKYVYKKTAPSLEKIYKDKKVPLNVRGNNPGNIKHSSANNWQGSTGDKNSTSKATGSFEVFDTPQNGARAMAIVADKHIGRVQKAGGSFEDFVLGYATEGSEKKYYDKNGVLPSHLQKYADTMASAFGLKAGDKLPERIFMLTWIKAQIKSEGGESSLKYFTDEILKEGINNAYK